jgi:hypothetical protein
MKDQSVLLSSVILLSILLVFKAAVAETYPTISVEQSNEISRSDCSFKISGKFKENPTSSDKPYIFICLVNPGLNLECLSDKGWESIPASQLALKMQPFKLADSSSLSGFEVNVANNKICDEYKGYSFYIGYASQASQSKGKDDFGRAYAALELLENFQYNGISVPNIIRKIGNHEPNLDDSSICKNKPMQEYDCAFGDKWNDKLNEVFVVNDEHNESKVCFKYQKETNYRITSLKDAKRKSIACVKPLDNRVKITREKITVQATSGNTSESIFIEGDPALYNDGENIYLTGTSATSAGWSNKVPIFEAKADGLFDFKLKQVLDLTAIDPTFIHCPPLRGKFTDSYKVDGVTWYAFMLNSLRVPKTVPCPDLNNKMPPEGSPIHSTYYFTAVKNSMTGVFDFNENSNSINAYYNKTEKRIVPIQQNAPLATSDSKNNGLASILGMHLDGNIYKAINGDRWLSWVWFENGNHIATAKLDNAFNFEEATDKSKFWAPNLEIIKNADPIQGEEGINEGANIFEYKGSAYMIFTRGHVVGCYGISYLRGQQIRDLSRSSNNPARPVFDSFPCDYGPKNYEILKPHPGLREIAGSGDVVKIKNDGLEEVYQFYGVGLFDKGHFQANENGDNIFRKNYLRRDIYYSKFDFYDDGAIVPLKNKPKNLDDNGNEASALNLRWSKIPGYENQLRILVNGQLEFAHPDSPNIVGICQVDAKQIRSIPANNQAEPIRENNILESKDCYFANTNSQDTSKNGKLSLEKIIELDGFELTLLELGNSNGNETKRKFKVGHNRLNNQQVIPVDITLAQEQIIDINWSDLTNYEYHITVLANGKDLILNPMRSELGLGHCVLSGSILGKSHYASLSGCYFVPQVGDRSKEYWIPINKLNITGVEIHYAYKGNWDIGQLRGLLRKDFKAEDFKITKEAGSSKAISVEIPEP